MQTDFAVRTIVSVGTSGKAVLANAANLACATFVSAAVGALVAAVIAATGREFLMAGVVATTGVELFAAGVMAATVVELVVAAPDVDRAEVVGTPLTAGALLAATVFVELAGVVGLALVWSATVVGPAGTLAAGVIGELTAALGAEGEESLLASVARAPQPAELRSTEAMAAARRGHLMIMKVLGRSAHVQHGSGKVTRLTSADVLPDGGR